jgi:hypothetical protein
MMALIISFLCPDLVVQTALRIGEDNCGVRCEPFLITLPTYNPSTLPGHYNNDTLLGTNYMF